MKATVGYILALLLFTSNVISAQNGSLDTSFNSTGSVMTDFGANDSAVHSMVLQPNGKIVVAGTVFNHGDYSQFGILRFNENGTPDPTFGDAGLAVSNIQGKISLNSVALQSNGKILAEGIIHNNYFDTQFVLTRFNTDGSPDTSFGDGGVVIVSAVNINSMVVLPASENPNDLDKILVAGNSFDLINRDFLLIRYDKDGHVDNGFGNNGIQTTSIGIRDIGYDIALQPDGKIVLVGSTQNNSGSHFSDFAILRYFSDGNPDTTFGSPNGYVIYDLDDVDEAKSVEVEADGTIVVAGWSYSATADTGSFKLIRLLPNGDLDPAFAGTGIATSPISFSSNQQLIIIQPDSKIVVAGTVQSGLTTKFALVRFGANGIIDTSFGANGIVTSSDGAETASKANALLQDPVTLKILAGGETGEASLSYHPQSVLRRYN